MILNTGNTLRCVAPHTLSEQIAADFNGASSFTANDLVAAIADGSSDAVVFRTGDGVSLVNLVDMYIPSRKLVVDDLRVGGMEFSGLALSGVSEFTAKLDAALRKLTLQVVLDVEDLGYQQQGKSMS